MQHRQRSPARKAAPARCSIAVDPVDAIARAESAFGWITCQFTIGSSEGEPIASTVDPPSVDDRRPGRVVRHLECRGQDIKAIFPYSPRISI